jgi:hypothetical protein
MTKKDDIVSLEFLRCPHCRARVESIWNLDTTGQVACVVPCSEGRFAMWVEDCVDVSMDEEDLMVIEDLEDV